MNNDELVSKPATSTPQSRPETLTFVITPTLKSKIAQYPNEHWSVVVCRAIASRLRILENTDIRDVEKRAVEQLKLAKEVGTKELHAARAAAGATYVLNHPEFTLLARLQSWAINLEPEDLNYISFYRVAQVMDKDGARVTEDYLREQYGYDIDNPIWVKGFIDGALRKYWKLMEKID